MYNLCISFYYNVSLRFSLAILQNNIYHCILYDFDMKIIKVSWLVHSTGNRKTRSQIPAHLKASLFPQKDFKFFKFE